jgi:methyl-accepting chemotaxis protein
MKLGIQFKLLGSFLVVCALTAVVAYVGAATAQTVKANLDNVGGNLLPTTMALASVSGNIFQAQRDIRAAVLVSDQKEIEALVAKTRAELAASEKAWAAYKALPFSPEEAKVIPVFEQNYQTWHDAVVNTAIPESLLNTPEGNAQATDLLQNKAAPVAAAANQAINDLVAMQGTQSVTAMSQAGTSYDQSLKILVGTSVAAILIALGIAVWLSRGIVNGVKQVQVTLTSMADNCATELEGALGAMARNDLTVAATATTRPIERYGADEIGQTAAVTNKMLGKLQSTIENYEIARAALQQLVGKIQQAAVGLADTSAQLGSAAAQTGAAVQQVTMAVQNVASGAQDTSRSAQETNAAVAQLSQVIDGIARGATDQAHQVQTTSATAAEMAAGVEEVAANATQMATAGQQTKIVAERGGQAVRETTAAMAEIQTVVGEAASKVRELGVLGQKIGAVVETIDDIAEQTNLLALNAAIEAARAGEHGKGFAVVADEVRKLAERSGRETKQIAELIQQVQTGTRDAVGAMDSGAARVELGSQKAAQAGQALDEILAAVQDTVRQVGEIASSTQQMSMGARSVTDAMTSISAVVEQSTAATEEMSAQAGAVTGSIQSIAAVSEQQSAATEEVSASTEEMSAQVEQMSAQAQELASMAEQLQGLAASFKLDTQAVIATAGVRKPAAGGATRTAVPLRRAA